MLIFWFKVFYIRHILQCKVPQNLSIGFTCVIVNKILNKRIIVYFFIKLLLPWGSGRSEAIPPPPRAASSTKFSPSIPGTSYLLTTLLPWNSYIHCYQDQLHGVSFRKSACDLNHYFYLMKSEMGNKFRVVYIIICTYWVLSVKKVKLRFAHDAEYWQSWQSWLKKEKSSTHL